MIKLDDTLKALDDGHLDFLYCDVLPLKVMPFYKPLMMKTLDALSSIHVSLLALMLRVGLLLHTASCLRCYLIKFATNVKEF